MAEKSKKSPEPASGTKRSRSVDADTMSPVETDSAQSMASTGGIDDGASGCCVCKKDWNDSLILLCDGCDGEYHTYCLVPPLDAVPEGDFFCPSCIKERESIANNSIEVTPKRKSVPVVKSSPVALSNLDSVGKPLEATKKNASFGKASKTGRPRKSQYRGVCKKVNGSQFLVSAGYKGERVHIGSFPTEEDAARAYDSVAYAIHGSKVTLNFPNEIPAPLPESIQHKLNLVDEKQNTIKEGTLKSETSYMGVTERLGKFQSHVIAHGRSIYLGTFASAHAAARVYDDAVAKFHGASGVYNFPDERNTSGNGAEVQGKGKGALIKTKGKTGQKKAPTKMGTRTGSSPIKKLSGTGIVEQNDNQGLKIETLLSKLRTCIELHEASSKFVPGGQGDSTSYKLMTDAVSAVLVEMGISKTASDGSSKKIPPLDTLGTATAHISFCRSLGALAEAPLFDKESWSNSMKETQRAKSKLIRTTDGDMAQVGRMMHEYTSSARTDFEALIVHRGSDPQDLVGKYVKLDTDTEDGRKMLRYGVVADYTRESRDTYQVRRVFDGELEARSAEYLQENIVTDDDFFMLREEGLTMATRDTDNSMRQAIDLYKLREEQLVAQLGKVHVELESESKELVVAEKALEEIEEATEAVTEGFNNERDACMSTESHASQDKIFLRDLYQIVTPALAELKEKCQDSVIRSIQALKARYQEFREEFEYLSTALVQMSYQQTDTISDDIGGGYIDFYLHQLKEMWSERSVSLETLRLLGRIVRASVASGVDRTIEKCLCDELQTLESDWEAIAYPKIARELNGISDPAFASMSKDMKQCIAVFKQDENKKMSTVVLFHPGCIDHATPSGHPECPERMKRAISTLGRLAERYPGSMKIERLNTPASKIAPSDVTLLMVHSPAYLEQLRQRSAEAALKDGPPLVFESQDASEAHGLNHNDAGTSVGGSLSGAIKRISAMDTYVCGVSWEVALIAAGTVCLAVDKVLAGDFYNAVCLVRPPGHHVGRDGCTNGAPSSGFCLLNNVVIGAMHARLNPAIQRIAVIDWDIHHGNGTEELLVGDKDAYFASVHLFTQDFFPGTGNDYEDPNIVNVALRNEGIGSGSRAFREAMSKKVIPSLDAFKPDIIFISAGFDGHRDDILGGQIAVKDSSIEAGYLEEDFQWATKEILRIADKHSQSRVISVLEGGYDVHNPTNSLAKCIASHIESIIIGNEVHCDLPLVVPDVEDVVTIIETKAEADHVAKREPVEMEIAP